MVPLILYSPVRPDRRDPWQRAKWKDTVDFVTSHNKILHKEIGTFIIMVGY